MSKVSDSASGARGRYIQPRPPQALTKLFEPAFAWAAKRYQVC